MSPPPPRPSSLEPRRQDQENTGGSDRPTEPDGLSVPHPVSWSLRLRRAASPAVLPPASAQPPAARPSARPRSPPFSAPAAQSATGPAGPLQLRTALRRRAPAPPRLRPVPLAPAALHEEVPVAVVPRVLPRPRDPPPPPSPRPERLPCARSGPRPIKP